MKTKLPWHLAYYAKMNGPGSHYSVKHGEKTIVRTINEVATNEDEANVNFIVKAVNMHDELVAALSDIFKHPHIQAFLPYDPTDETFQRAMAILKKARTA